MQNVRNLSASPSLWPGYLPNASMYSSRTTCSSGVHRDRQSSLALACTPIIKRHFPVEHTMKGRAKACKDTPPGTMDCRCECASYHLFTSRRDFPARSSEASEATRMVLVQPQRCFLTSRRLIPRTPSLEASLHLPAPASARCASDTGSSTTASK